MAVIESRVDTASSEYAANRDYFISLLEELAGRYAEVARGGGAEALAKHTARGKIPVRQRVALLLDPGSPFLEFSPLAAWEMYGGEAPRAPACGRSRPGSIRRPSSCPPRHTTPSRRTRLR